MTADKWGVSGHQSFMPQPVSVCGLDMLKRLGWEPGEGLGKTGQGIALPVGLTDAERP